MVAGGAVALVPSVAVAAARSPALYRAAWSKLIASVIHLHSNAPAALQRAINAGVDPRTFSLVTLTGPREEHLPALFFGDWQGPAFTVIMPHEGQVVQRFN